MRRRRRALPPGARPATQASYGITDYVFAISQLAQTTLRSEVGKIDLDRTFEERAAINAAVVSELDKASRALGRQGAPLRDQEHHAARRTCSHAMEKQMRAEREKRAVILASEGERDAKINQAEGEKQQVIKASEATRQQQINEARGRGRGDPRRGARDRRGARQHRRGRSQLPGGDGAMRLRIAEQYIAQFGELAKAGNTFVVPANLSDLASMLTLASTVLRDGGARAGGAAPAPRS